MIDAAAGGRAVGAARVGAAAPPSEQRGYPGGNQNPGYQDKAPEPEQSPWFQTPPQEIEYHGGYDPNYDPSEQYAQWYEQEQQATEYREQYEEEPRPRPGTGPRGDRHVPHPGGPGRPHP